MMIIMTAGESHHHMMIMITAGESHHDDKIYGDLTILATVLCHRTTIMAFSGSP